MQSAIEPSLPGNPSLRLLRVNRVTVVRARMRRDVSIARFAKYHQVPAQGSKSFAEIAAMLNERGVRMWRGRPWTAASLKRLMRRYYSSLWFGPGWYLTQEEKGSDE